MIYVISIATFFKVIKSRNLSSVSIKILVSSNFAMPIVSLTLYNFYLLQFFPLLHDHADQVFLLTCSENI